jgi:putative ABC transport system permease protein
MRRVKEASMRRALGAKRAGLVKQFLGESLLIAMVAFVLSLILFAIAHQPYVQLAGDLPDAGLMATAIAFVFVIAVIIGILGGIFPAVRLSSLDLAHAFKGGKAPKSKRLLQNALIVTQFVSAVFLIIATIVATNQISMMRNMDLGFNKEGILVLRLNGNNAADRADILKQRLHTLSEVKSVCAMTGTPGIGTGRNGYTPEGMENPIIINAMDVDKDFLDTYGIKLLQGRFFSGGEQDRNFYVVNETLAKTYGWHDNAIGKYINRSGNHEIIGVVSDFNFESLYRGIKPLIITNAPANNRFHSLSINYHSTNLTAMLSNVEKVWMEVNPDTPFEYSFLDEMYDRQYKMEISFCALFAVFATIAIILAVLGVLSLMAYTTEQRKKEIGIRKVMGATVKEILTLLLKRTGVQIVVANLIACPLAWWVAKMALESFAYRISVGPFIFISAFVISALAALLAVGFQAYKAASANPLDSIKSE